jgi:DinB superfamily
MEKTANDLLITIDNVLPLLQNLTEPAVSARTAPGKWSKKEIMGHLIDSACNNQQKFVRIVLAEGAHVDFVGYKQDSWVAAQAYQSASWADLLALWAAYNRQLAHFIRHIPQTKHGADLSIDGVGCFRLDFIVPDYVEHLRHHLKAVLPDTGLERRFSNVYGAY